MRFTMALLLPNLEKPFEDRKEPIFEKHKAKIRFRTLKIVHEIDGPKSTTKNALELNFYL